MPEPSPISTASRCPLCRSDNQCSIAATESINYCWCKDANFNERMLQLSKLPNTVKHCICAACASKLQQLSTEL